MDRIISPLETTQIKILDRVYDGIEDNLEYSKHGLVPYVIKIYSIDEKQYGQFTLPILFDFHSVQDKMYATRQALIGDYTGGKLGDMTNREIALLLEIII